MKVSILRGVVVELLDRTNGPIVTVLFSILMKVSILRGVVVELLL